MAVGCSVPAGMMRILTFALNPSPLGSGGPCRAGVIDLLEGLDDRDQEAGTGRQRDEVGDRHAVHITKSVIATSTRSASTRSTCPSTGPLSRPSGLGEYAVRVLIGRLSRRLGEPIRRDQRPGRKSGLDVQRRSPHAAAVLAGVRPVVAHGPAGSGPLTAMRPGSPCRILALSHESAKFDLMARANQL